MWKLTRQPHRVFARNPLLAVVFAVDFEPILKIGEGKSIPDFQELIRARFPSFTEGEVMEFEIKAPGNFETRQEKAFEFSASGDLKVVLAPRRLSRDARVHWSRDELYDDIRLILGALQEVYKPIVITRVGLRYINLFDRV